MSRLMFVIEEHSLMRMIGWLPAGVLFYVLSVYVFTYDGGAQLQLLSWKLGHVCTFTWIGYWVARQASGRLQDLKYVNTTWEAIIYAARVLARAIIVFGALQAANGL